MEMTISQMKEDVCRWARVSYSEHLFAGTSGNLSVYDHDKQLMVITPTSFPYELLTPDDMVVMHLDGTCVTDASLRPSSEWRMHAVIYRQMPEVNAVIHTHSPYATAFAVNHKPIPAALIEMVAFLGGDVPLAAFAMPGTENVGTEAVKIMTDRTACLLANHGVLAIGNTLESAHTRAVYVEDAARICSIAAGNGSIFTIEDKYIDAMRGRKGNNK